MSRYFRRSRIEREAALANRLEQSLECSEEILAALSDLQGELQRAGRFEFSKFLAAISSFATLGTIIFFSNSLLMFGMTLTPKEALKAHEFSPYLEQVDPESMIDFAIMSGGALQLLSYWLWLALTVWLLWNFTIRGTLSSYFWALLTALISPSLLFAITAFASLTAASVLADRPVVTKYDGFFSYAAEKGRKLEEPKED